MSEHAVGTLLRHWRTRRGRSQMALALDVGVSPRHLSFVETGRSRPSAELLLALSEELSVPLRERNVLLLAAGYAPRYTESALGDAALVRVRAALQRMLDTHHPYPGVVIDRAWNIVLANRAAEALVADLPPHLLGPPVNVFRACLHPDGLAARTRNFAEWSAYLLEQMSRTAALTGDPALSRLLDEVMAYPTVAGGAVQSRPAADEPTLLVPLRLDAGGGRELSLFTTLTTFGTPRDITLAELSVELFFPADDASDALLRQASPPDGPTPGTLPAT
ncbi:MAG TPA: helix-turn-helix transcriptional regulator [Gemmatimonadaceae bacterium]